MKKRNLVLSSLVLAALIILAGCGGGGGGGTSSSPPFSQADLTGNWHISILQSSPTLTLSSEPGWLRGTASVDNAGHITITSFFTSATGTVSQASYPQGIIWSIDPWTGIIIESSGTYTTANPDFHGKLASNKQLIVGTATNQNATSTPKPIQLRILQKKVPTTIYTAADIQNIAFTMHQIDSGVSDIWTHATGSTDGAANASLGVRTTATGTTLGGPAGTLLLDPATGLVTLNSNTYFQGMLSPDKSYIVATETAVSPSNLYRLTVVQIASKPSQTFATSDAAGSWHFHGLIGGMPAWVYQTVSIGSSGQVTITSELTSMGTPSTLPPGTTAQVDSDGNFTSSDDPTLHATLSSNKDMLVTTQTITDSGFFPMLGVAVK